MTRKQIWEQRRKKRRRQLIRRYIEMAVALAAIFFLVFFVIRPALSNSRQNDSTVSSASEDTSKTSSDTESAADTAIKQTLADAASGSSGWNADDTGWWYKNSDDTKYVSGWKTIEGQRYYFKDDGYIATGWINTGSDEDSYFDASGILDPTAKQKLCAVTFDDGPSQNTDTILDVLEQYKAKATFFVVGTQASYYSDELKREYADGMEIGSHTYDHITLSTATAEQIQDTMNKNDALIQQLTGFVPTIMRPTGGGVNDLVKANVSKPMINWDVDTLDWKTRDAAQTVATATANVKDGSIILMHDLYQSTAEAAKTLIPSLQQMGYKLVTVSELAQSYGYTLEPGQVYYDFRPQQSTESTKTADSFQTITDSIPDISGQ